MSTGKANESGLEKRASTVERLPASPTGEDRPAIVAARFPPSTGREGIADQLRRIGREPQDRSASTPAQLLARVHGLSDRDKMFIALGFWAVAAICAAIVFLFAHISGPTVDVDPEMSARVAEGRLVSASPAAGVAKQSAATGASSASRSSPAELSSPAGKSGGYRLRNVVTGQCLSLVNRRIRQFGCGEPNAGDQQWRLQRTRKVSGVQLYWLRGLGAAQTCVDVPNYGSEPDGTLLSDFGCMVPASGDNQEWRLKAVGRSATDQVQYALINQASGQCMDVALNAADGSDKAPGQAVGLSRCHAASYGWDDHLWVFE